MRYFEQPERQDREVVDEVRVTKRAERCESGGRSQEAEGVAELKERQRATMRALWTGRVIFWVVSI